MKLVLALVLAASGCRGILGLGDAELVDANQGPADAPRIDARTCFGARVEVCLPELPSSPIAYTGVVMINSPDECDHRVASDGVELCVIAGTTILVAHEANVRTTGPLYVVFVASERITIEGTLESWTSGPDPACPFTAALGRSGGAGGSFGTQGGTGGSADGGGTTPRGPVGDPIGIRDGCRGGTGGSNGGNGNIAGGAIALIAPTIELTPSALLNASGFPGTGAGLGGSGGGGGGSGGMISLDATRIEIAEAAVVIALGGGGGEGSDSASAGRTGSRTVSTQAAVGGAGLALEGGDGGAGAAAQPAMGGAPGTIGIGIGGGGGGGGGLGAILFTAPLIDNMGIVLPAPQ